jgi:hypothetical protein
MSSTSCSSSKTSSIEDEFDLEIPDDFNLSQLGNVGEVKTAIETFLAGGADNGGR